jgi:outer membrane protein TolC
VQLEGSRLVTSINLVKALGGDWQESDAKRKISEK